MQTQLLRKELISRLQLSLKSLRHSNQKLERLVSLKNTEVGCLRQALIILFEKFHNSFSSRLETPITDLVVGEDSLSVPQNYITKVPSDTSNPSDPSDQPERKRRRTEKQEPDEIRGEKIVSRFSSRPPSEESSAQRSETSNMRGPNISRISSNISLSGTPKCLSPAPESFDFDTFSVALSDRWAAVDSWLTSLSSDYREGQTDFLHSSIEQLINTSTFQATPSINRKRRMPSKRQSAAETSFGESVEPTDRESIDRESITTLSIINTREALLITTTAGEEINGTEDEEGRLIDMNTLRLFVDAYSKLKSDFSQLLLDKNHVELELETMKQKVNNNIIYKSKDLLFIS